MNEDHIQDLLRTLARADATAEAPPEIELRLRREFRSRKRRRRWTRLAWCASAAAAVLVVVVATWHYRQPRAVLPRAEVQEVVTDFYPLVNPAPPFERGRLLRVELPASAMRMVGLPVHAERLSDTVQADVLVGEEGLPRAIRFVKFETK
jgi:hypothetical protein